MFDKLRNKLGSNDYLISASQSRRSSSVSSRDDSGNLPAYKSQRSSADSRTPPSYHSRSMSRGDRGRQRALSSPGNVDRQQEASRASTPSTPKRRHVFWKSSLWNSKHRGHPDSANIRAKSSSVALPHPSVAEEQMRNMPHHDWQGKNKPDDTYDEANLARLYS